MSDYIKKQDVLDILYNTFEEYNMTTDKQDKHGGFGAEVFKRVKEQPTLDEKEIIRKPFERVVERLETLKDEYDHSCLDNAYQRGAGDGAKWLKKKAIEIVKEECGISE